jgi:hypothetical protein
MPHLSEDLKETVYYATYEREDMKGYANSEYIMKMDKGFVRPDFICLKNKKVIEFDGDYWHSVGVREENYEQNRDNKIEQAGYQILHVKECDFKSDRENTIKQCIQFLTT